MVKWETLKSNFYFRDGALRDIIIYDFSIEYWKKWIEFINQNYLLEWWHIYNGRNNEKIDKVDFEKKLNICGKILILIVKE